MSVLKPSRARVSPAARNLLGWSVAGCLALALPALAQTEVLIEPFEFATSDEAAEAGVVDMTDTANRPAFYINGECDIPPSPCDEVAEGLFSIGTDAVFCQQFCQAGSRIGFRRYLTAAQFPNACPGPDGHHFAPLNNTYGDPDHPGATAPDFPLSELVVLIAAYGEGAFADGPNGTHFWINLVDCEGEVFEYINFDEAALYSKLWTFDLDMGRDIIRLSPDSLSGGVPVGDGLLTEIAAIDVFIQDADNPPTTFGKWYADDLRIVEPESPAVVPAVTGWGAAALALMLLAAATVVFRRIAAHNG